MRSRFFILANAAELSEGRKLSLLGADFDTIQSPSFPAAHSSMYVVAKLLCEPRDYGRPHQMYVAITGPDGAEVIRTSGITMDAPAAPTPGDRAPQLALLAQVVGLPLPSAGRYSVRLFVDGAELASTELEARLAPPRPEENP